MRVKRLRLRVRLRSENEQCVAHFCAMWVLSALLRVSAAALLGVGMKG
jgi:hypothetical protein